MTRKKKPIAKQGVSSPPAAQADTPRPPEEAVQAAAVGPDAGSEGLQAGPDTSFPIVGIGASAGGLAAFEAFFSGMPPDQDPGMAFVLVQHLAPDHKSILSDLVRRYARMQVFDVEDGIKVQPNCTYIIPPNHDMALLNGSLHLLEPSAPRGMRLPIDFFFRSLAQDQHERAVCIVLSGSGSDGSLGVRAVKGEGGMAMAQKPESADYDGMPRSAIATGLVDYVLPPAEMAGRLIAYAAHALGRTVRPESAEEAPGAEHLLQKICVLLRDRTGHDFSTYKQSTLVRRIERRMALHQIARPEDYVRHLRRNPEESRNLFHDLLIGVTGFFRDPDAFAVLETKEIPRLFDGKPAGAPVRVWVCGCATGEEAYSIAILLQEYMETRKQTFSVQVFATDIDPRAIEQARAGVYQASVAADVPPERLARFFNQDPDLGTYRVRKVIRDLLVFSGQNVTRDPPFSRLDLISCRNLLIYLKGDQQKRLISLFHYALNPGGSLFLGPSETVGDCTALFAPLDRKWKLYQRRQEETGRARHALGDFVPALSKPDGRGRAPRADARGETPAGPRELVERTLLSHYAQTGVLINGRGDILYIYGRTGKYLEPAAGHAVMNVLNMAREGLRRELEIALRMALTKKQPVHCPGLRVRTNGETLTAHLTLRPVEDHGGETPSDLFLVILEEAPPQAPPPDAGLLPADGAGSHPPFAAEAEKRIAALELELRAKEEYLQTTLEEMETSSEELKSTNEEMQSVNEELQSTNEELETSREELQSINEEMATVNTELQAKVADLAHANNDMNNLLAGTGVATLFVDLQLRIVRFTPPATQLINLIQTDIGRPVDHIVSNLKGYDRLAEEVTAVLDDLAPREAEVQTRAGAWFLMRIRPYRTLENVIEGGVITFTDITELKRARDTAHEAQAFTESVVDAVREPLVVLAGDLTVVSANRAFYRTFRMEPGSAVGRKLFELGDREWDIPDLRRLLEEILARDNSFDGFEVTHEFKVLGRRTILLNARRIRHTIGGAESILLAMEDITDRPN